MSISKEHHDKDNFELIQRKQKETEEKFDVATTDGDCEPQLSLKKRHTQVPARYQQEVCRKLCINISKRIGQYLPRIGISFANIGLIG